MASPFRLSERSLERYRRQLELKRAMLERGDDRRFDPREPPHPTPRPEKGLDREGLLKDINLALAAIDNGTYGRCTECGEPIAALRLKAVPETRLCLLCAYP